MLVIKFNSCFCGSEHPSQCERARFSRKVSSNNVCTAFRGRMRKYCTRGNQNYKENISKKVILVQALLALYPQLFFDVLMNVASSKFLSGRNVFGHPFDILRGGKNSIIGVWNGQHSDISEPQVVLFSNKCSSHSIVLREWQSCFVPGKICKQSCVLALNMSLSGLTTACLYYWFPLF